MLHPQKPDDILFHDAVPAIDHAPSLDSLFLSLLLAPDFSSLSHSFQIRNPLSFLPLYPSIPQTPWNTIPMPNLSHSAGPTQQVLTSQTHLPPRSQTVSLRIVE
ncbi:hypothetical protein BDV19DRAFT_334713 [Aspergillus venezuelensis]